MKTKTTISGMAKPLLYLKTSISLLIVDFFRGWRLPWSISMREASEDDPEATSGDDIVSIFVLL